MNEQEQGLKKRSMKKNFNKRLIIKLNQTINKISTTAFELQQDDRNKSRYSKSMMCSARTTPQMQPFNCRENQMQKSANIDKFISADKTYKKVRVADKQQFQLTNKQIFSKTTDFNLLKSASQNQNQLFLTMQGGFNFKPKQFSQTALAKPKIQKQKIKLDRKWKFEQFINILYFQKSKDLKTKPNSKQQNLFVQRFRKKFVCFDYNEICTFVQYGKQSNFIIKELILANSDLGANSIRCICEYILSKKITRISIEEMHSFCNIKSIFLDKNPLGDQGIQILSEAITYFRFLQKLSLVSVNMSPKGAKKILKSLMNLQNLKYVDFSSSQGLNRNRFGQSMSEMQLLFSHPGFSWQHVNLSSINCGFSGLNTISNGITKSCSIKQIFLSQNDIKAAQIPYFLSKFKYTTISHLDLSNNQIGDEGFRLISQLISHQYGYNPLSRSLNILNVSNNLIRSYGIELFCKGMINNQALTQLYISDNYLSKGEGFVHFKYFISKNWTLKKIDMSNSFTNSEDLRHLFEGLQDNRILEQLNLSKNNISLQSFAFLAKMLAVNKGLKIVQLQSCNICDKYFEKFQKDLKQIRNLEQINLSNNYLSDKSSKIIIQMIGNSKSISKALFGKNCLGVRTQNDIHSLLKSNKSRDENSKLDQKQMEYLKYIQEIQINHEEAMKNSIQKLQQKQNRIKFTSLVCQLVKKQLQEEQKKKELHDQLMKIKQLQEKLKKKLIQMFNKQFFIEIQTLKQHMPLKNLQTRKYQQLQAIFQKLNSQLFCLIQKKNQRFTFLFISFFIFQRRRQQSRCYEKFNTQSGTQTKQKIFLLILFLLLISNIKFKQVLIKKMHINKIRICYSRKLFQYNFKKILILWNFKLQYCRTAQN